MGWEGNEFTIALLVGILIITIGVLIFNSDISFSADGFGSSQPINRYRGDQFGYMLVTEDSGKNILIGSVQKLDSRSEGLGTFDVRTTSERIVAQKTLFNGLLFGDNELKINGDVRELNLDVISTNDQGNLIITADNGKEKRVVLDKPLGVGKFTIPVDNDGTLVIKAASSGWKIWAPTQYEVFVEAYAVNEKEARATFEVESDVDKVDVAFRFTDYRGILRIKINDRIYLERDVREVEVLTFDRKELEDINEIEMTAWDGSVFRGRIDIVKHRIIDDFGRFEMDFFINNTAALDKRPGKITFDVVRVTGPGQLILKIRNAEGNVVLTRNLDLYQQTYVEYFTRTHVKPGVNTVIIESDGRSTFWISDIRLWMAD